MNSLNSLSRPTAILLTVACSVIVIAGLRSASEIISPLLIACFFAIISTPPINWLQSKGFTKTASFSIVLSCFALLCIMSVSGISDSIDEIGATLPFYEDRLARILVELGEWLYGIGLLPSDTTLRSLVNPGRMASLFGQLLGPARDLVANLFLILFAVLFILAESGALHQKFEYLLSKKKLSFTNLHSFTKTVNRYFLIKTAISLVTGLFIAIWLLVLDVDFAILWAWLAFFLNFVPYIGSILAAIPAVLIALLGQGPELAGYTALGFLIANVVVGNFVEPRFLGKGLGLSTLVVFLSMIFWGWVLGPVGMFLSAPLTTLLKIGVESDEQSRWLGVLLGTGSELTDKSSENEDS